MGCFHGSKPVGDAVRCWCPIYLEFGNYAAVEAAFWLKANADDQWFLCLASEEIDDTNFDIAYGEVQRISSRLSDPWLSPFEIKVMGSTEPVAKAVIEFQQKHPGKLPIRYRGRPLGNVSVQEVYIYRLPIMTPTT
jgi:hypothetical protein